MYNIDEIKEAVLQYMDTLSKQRPGQAYPPHWIGGRVSQITQFPRKEVVEAVYFLCDDGLLKKVRDGGVDKFRLASRGDQVFTPTKFAKQTSLSHITYNQQGGVAVYGSGNTIGTINQTTMSSIDELNKLITLFDASSLEQDKKLDAIADVETIKTQLTKPNPDSNILQRAWEAVVLNAQVINGIAEVSKVIQVLYPLIRIHAPSLPPLPSLFQNLA